MADMGDLLLAVGLLVLGLLPPDDAFGRPVDWLFYAVHAAAALAVAARGRLPVAVLFCACGGLAVLLGLGYPPGLSFGPALVALYTVAALGRRHMALAGVGAVLVGAAFLPVELTARAIYVVTCAGVLGCAVLAGEIVRARASAAEREERLRIARELHDVLGHGMAAIAVQSATALHLLGDGQPEVRQALLAVRDTSKEAMGLVRAGVFHEGESLDRLDRLLAAVRQAGLPVDATGSAGALPPEVDHAAYRIVQEALTNTLRHAGPGAAAVVRLERTRRALLVEISDTGSGGAVTPGGGIKGMKARAESLGGRVSVESADGVKVSARLPVRHA